MEKKKREFFFFIFSFISHIFLQLDMSWGGFKKAINRAGASVIVKDVDKTMDKDFDEERRYKTLKTAGTNLQKAAKGIWTTSEQSRIPKSQLPRLFITCRGVEAGTIALLECWDLLHAECQGV